MAERILVVENEEAVRETIVSVLRSGNYECHGAGNGLEALALLDSGKQFEMILCKLRMPNLEGIGLLERLRDKYSDIQLVVTTSVEDISIALGAIRNGAYDYLLKPFDREQLLDAVSRALENRRLKVENRTYQTNLESLVKARTEQLQAIVHELERSYDMTLEGFGDALALSSVVLALFPHNVRSAILTDERSLQFQLRRNKIPQGPREQTPDTLIVETRCHVPMTKDNAFRQRPTEQSVPRSLDGHGTAWCRSF